MLTFQITTHCEAETLAAGERLAQLLRGGDIILLDGDLGAGKTRFSKGIARGLGVQSELTSPTFNLVLEYPLAAHEECADTDRGALPKMLRHFDLYRLDNAEQLEDLDYFGLIEQEDAVSLVEWGSKFSESLPLSYLQIYIEVDEDRLEQRTLEFCAQGDRSETLLVRFADSEKAEQHG